MSNRFSQYSHLDDIMEELKINNNIRLFIYLEL